MIALDPMVIEAYGVEAAPDWNRVYPQMTRFLPSHE